MNYIKLFVLSLLSVGAYSYSAVQEPKVPAACAHITKNKCVGSSCESINTMISAIKQKCIQEQNDASTVKTSKDVSKIFLNSDLGYLLAFSRVILSQKAPSQYESIKKDFNSITQKYDQYLKTDAKNYLEQFKKDESYYQNETNSHAKNKILIDRNIKILNFMLESEQSFSLYQDTYKKILLDIFDPVKAVKFKNKTFSQYECKFLSTLFDKETVQDLKQSIQFTCIEKY